jgi:hypothetical protein
MVGMRSQVPLILLLADSISDFLIGFEELKTETLSYFQYGVRRSLPSSSRTENTLSNSLKNLRVCIP